ncbi:MAG: dihydrofolate reductase family protein, partial [Chloroflexi bacterium]|nr:dihydrofolate reductase family protein [Chloroflexota bacterium]
HLWTAEYVYPPFAPAYQKLRKDWGRSTPPLNVIVTASGNLELDRPVFQSASVPTLIVTTDPGYTRLTKQAIPTSTQAISVGDTKTISAQSILEAIRDAARSNVILVEGGPRLFGGFLAEQVVDELFLTLAPQIAGRDDLVQRPGLVSGKRFAPEHPLWGQLVSLKRSESHLFLRYSCRQPVL